MRAGMPVLQSYYNTQHKNRYDKTPVNLSNAHLYFTEQRQ